MLKAVVIGTGAMGKNHIRVYNSLENADLVAIADVDKTRARQLGEKFSVKWYTSYMEMLQKEKPDVVSVVVPTALHHKVALDVIESGCNLLIEKPISANVKEAEEIIQKAEQKGVKITVGHIERFNPAVMKLKELIDKNIIGKVWSISTIRKGPFPNRIRDVGVVIDLAVHDLDVMNYLLNSKVVRISAEAERKIHTEKEDFMNALIRFENGVVGILDVNWLTPVKVREIFINGERGVLKADYITQKVTLFENGYLNGDIEYNEVIKGVTVGRQRSIEVERTEPLKLELMSFIDAINNNKAPAVSGKDGLVALTLAEKILKIANKGNEYNGV